MAKPPADGVRQDDAGGGTSGGRGQVIHVATRCASLDEFVERFAALAWEGSLVLPAAVRLPIGTQGRFVIVLRDQSVAMRGRCRVTEVRQAPAANNPSSAPPRFMLRVALLEMDDASRDVHRRLLALRSAPVPLPVPPEPSETTQIEPARAGAAPPRVPAPVPPTTARPTPPPPVRINQTMIGVGPVGRIPGTPAPPFPQAPAPVPVPAAAPAPGPAPVPAPVHDTAPVVVRPETRVPGAPDTLPANPLSELNIGDLNSFIETTLLEGDADSGPHVLDADPTLADKRAAAPAGAPAATRSAAARKVNVIALVALRHVQRLWARLPPPTRAIVKRWGPLVGCLLAGVVIGFALRGSPAPAPPRAEVAAVAPAAAAAAAPAPAPAPPEPAPEPELEPVAAKVEPPAPPAKPAAAASRPVAAKAADAAPSAAAADGDCTARVITEPKDAKVIWGGKLIGRTPIQKAQVPCGPASVTLDRDRYQMVTVDVTANARAVTSVREKLRRPRGTLFVTSTPPGAQVTFNRQAVGVTPKRIEVWRYEKLPVKVTLAGYASWSKSVYLKEAETKVDAQLVRK
jgi:hypothetical protein